MSTSQEPPLGGVQVAQVLAYRHEAPLFWISAYMAVNMWLVMLVFSFGLIIPILLFLALLGMFAHSMLIAWLKGNSVRVTAEQFPQLYEHYLYCCTRLGMARRPELYLAQSDGILNAMATRFMRRDYVVLLSAVVDALEDRPQAIKFYMGHELGHIKRKHLSRHWWLWPGMMFPLLSPAYARAREYTCDRHGFACCDNLEDAKRALAVLVTGPDAWKNLNIEAFERQAQESGGFWMAVNELTADYPWLCKRMMVLENRNAVFPRRSFFAWMIAAVSPRMGYGGAVVGFLYWLLLGVFILVLVGALLLSKADFSMPALFGKNPVAAIIERVLIGPHAPADSHPDEDCTDCSEKQTSATSDSEPLQAPPGFTLVPGKKAIAELKLNDYLSADWKANNHELSSDNALVSDGDITIDENISMWTFADRDVHHKANSPLGQSLLKDARLLIVRGDLNCKNLNTSAFDGIFVFGNLRCDVVSIGMAPLYVQGNFIASSAIIANAEDDEGDAQSTGKQLVRVDGMVASPVVKTWYFRLSHLKFASESAKEIAVEKRDPRSDGATYP